MVLDSNAIKSLVVNTEMKGTILFFDEEHRSTSRGLRVSDESLSQVFFNICLQGSLFRFSKAINRSPRRLSSRQEVNSTVIRMMYR